MAFERHSRIALIGRPNVGKSTLFNKLTRTRKAVVRDEPGVTRDVLIEPAEWWGYKFDVVDTGGITEDQSGFSPLIRTQVIEMLSSVDLLLVIMDGRVGLVPEDRDIIRIAKEAGKPFLIVINKLDRQGEIETALSEFYEFGMDVLPAAFEIDFGTDMIVEWIVANMPSETNSQRQGVRLAVIGKPNVGKSSLCNYLLGAHRMLVSEIAGTTVDAVEAEFTYAGNPYVIVDTAGLRRQARRKEGVEFLSAFKSHEAVNKCDVALLVVDGNEGPTAQDAKMLEYCLARHKAVILVANKYDVAKDSQNNFRDWFRDKVATEFRFFPDIRVVFVSAKSAYGMREMFKEIDDVYTRLQTRISTSKLNKFFFEVIRRAPAPVYGTNNVKFFYLTQTHQVPPSFIAFANHPEGVTSSYRRFLINRIKEEWDLKGIPIRIFAMNSGGRRKGRSKADEDASAEAIKNAVLNDDFDETQLDDNIEGFQ